MASKMEFPLRTVCCCCPGSTPCDKITYQCYRSFPSMVQINSFQTSEFSAFTLYKKRDPLKPPHAGLLLMRWPVSDMSHFHGQDENQEERPIPSLHPKDVSQSASDGTEGKDKTQAEQFPLFEEMLNTKPRTDKRRKCLFCGKLYARLSTLRIHMRIHLGVKPYRCPYCQKAFTQSGNRTTHMRIHTGAKPYVCARCGRGFAQSSALKSHMLTHK